MPLFDWLYWSKDSGDQLDVQGPTIQVEISLPSPLTEFCAKSNIPIPSPIAGYALIDTGASATAVHEKLLLGLGVLPIDSIPTHTPHGEGRSFIYPATISFPGLGLTNIPMSRVMGCDLDWSFGENNKVVMLMGRDLLKHFLFEYHGPGSRITLAY